jgi:hypothetical protein
LSADKTLKVRYTCNDNGGTQQGESLLRLDDVFVGIAAPAEGGGEATATATATTSIATTTTTAVTEAPTTTTTQAGTTTTTSEEKTTTTTSAAASTTTTASVTSANFLRNPGFEDGSLNNWSIDGSDALLQTYSPKAHSGSYYV